MESKYLPAHRWKISRNPLPYTMAEPHRHRMYTNSKVQKISCCGHTVRHYRTNIYGEFVVLFSRGPCGYTYVWNPFITTELIQGVFSETQMGHIRFRIDCSSIRGRQDLVRLCKCSSVYHRHCHHCTGRRCCSGVGPACMHLDGLFREIALSIPPKLMSDISGEAIDIKYTSFYLAQRIQLCEFGISMRRRFV